MKVTLVDYPRDLIGTFGKVWAMSKTDGDWRNVDREEAEREFMRILDAEVPVLRYANFVWIIEDMPVFFREQLVRAKHEDFWIQSMRVANMQQFYEDVRFHIPEDLSLDAHHAYTTVMETIGQAYNTILEDHPEEVARRVLPLATLHRGAWFTNLQALMERFKKRSCWVAEDLWVGVLAQVRRELVDKVHPAFESICTPPCFKRNDNQYQGCTINEIMNHRLHGEDPLPLCPLWAFRNTTPGDVEYYGEGYEGRTSQFAELWGRDPHTGSPVSEGPVSRGHGDHRS